MGAFRTFFMANEVIFGRSEEVKSAYADWTYIHTIPILENIFYK